MGHTVIGCLEDVPGILGLSLSWINGFFQTLPTATFWYNARDVQRFKQTT